MSDSIEAAIQRAAAGAAATGPATPIVIKEDRSIVVPTAMQQIAVQCDNEANVLHFVCPRNWADIDLAAATLYINVVKPDKSIVAFVCTNVVSSEDTITFDWVVTEPVTDVVGNLSFLVCARDPSDPGNGYRWHSNLCDSLFVAPGIVCVVPSDTPDPPHIPLYGTDTTLTKPHVPADAAAVGEQLSSLSEKITNLPQADWNQNDDTQPDYVKNRPFYTGDPVETVLVEETTAPFSENTGLYVAEVPSTFDATVGETYKVSWDGADYECACVAMDGTPLLLIGNMSIFGAGSDTGEPFVIIVYPNGNGMGIGTSDISDSHTISISKTVVPVVKIDKKYLVQPDWNQNDENAADFVKNRPFYSGTRNMTVEAQAASQAILERFPVFAVGDTVTVSVDGVEYSLVAYDDEGVTAIGDTYSSINNGEGQLGWQIGVNPEGQVWFDSEEAHTVSYLAHVDYAIDAKYLPDNLATKSEVAAAQTTANAAQTAARNAQTTANAALAKFPLKYSDVVDTPFSAIELPGKVTAYSRSKVHGGTFINLILDSPVGLTGSGFYKVSSDVLDFEDIYKISYQYKYGSGNSGNLISVDDLEPKVIFSSDHSVFVIDKKILFCGSTGTFTITVNKTTYSFSVAETGIYTVTHVLSNSYSFVGYIEVTKKDAVFIQSGKPVLIPSSTEGSTKKFKITVDDSGKLTATEV